jgi:hypothetical protein
MKQSAADTFLSYVAIGERVEKKGFENSFTVAERRRRKALFVMSELIPSCLTLLDHPPRDHHTTRD